MCLFEEKKRNTENSNSNNNKKNKSCTIQKHSMSANRNSVCSNIHANIAVAGIFSGASRVGIERAPIANETNT